MAEMNEGVPPEYRDVFHNAMQAGAEWREWQDLYFLFIAEGGVFSEEEKRDYETYEAYLRERFFALSGALIRPV